MTRIVRACAPPTQARAKELGWVREEPSTPNFPTKIRRLKISRIFPMDMIISPLNIKILLESNPPKSRIFVRRLAV